MFKVLLVSEGLPALGEGQINIEEFSRETIKEANACYRGLLKSAKRESRKDGASRRIVLCLCGAEVAKGKAKEWGAVPGDR